MSPSGFSRGNDVAAGLKVESERVSEVSSGGGEEGGTRFVTQSKPDSPSRDKVKRPKASRPEATTCGVSRIGVRKGLARPSLSDAAW